MKDFDKIIGRNAITMIYFFTSQCVPCEAMEPALDQFERRMAGRVDIYRINTDADENAYLLYRYMIRTTPTLIYFRKGDEIRRCEGPLTYKELLALQEQVETVEHVCLSTPAARSSPPRCNGPFFPARAKRGIFRCPAVVRRDSS